VGRLDLNSEGLLILTNSGAFSRFAEHPSTGWKRTYKVRVFGYVDELKLKELAHGITIDGVHYKGIDAVLSRQSGHNAWLLITLIEGKNREIRKVLNHLGLDVNRLIRIAYGPFELGTLKPGAIKECSKRVVQPFLSSVKE
jgi:23S rRNA pseudouridine2605 synthase